MVHYEIKIAETLFTAIMLWNEFKSSEIEALWLSCIKIWGARFTSESFVFSVMAVWIAEVLFMFILLCNRQNIAAYEAYWFMGFPIINC